MYISPATSKRVAACVTNQSFTFALNHTQPKLQPSGFPMLTIANSVAFFLFFYSTNKQPIKHTNKQTRQVESDTVHMGGSDSVHWTVGRSSAPIDPSLDERHRSGCALQPCTGHTSTLPFAAPPPPAGLPWVVRLSTCLRVGRRVLVRVGRCE
jgi:hypothetical protein